jgi:ribose transport system substrate-binding protein
MKLKTLAASAVALAAAVAVTAAPAMASPDKPVIALSNSYYGNIWRHQMVEAFEAAAQQAKSAGTIADFVVLNGDGSVSQQNSQLAELILKGVDAIAVDAASETAENGIIQKACRAGIKVISFDSIASAPCNTQLNFDFNGYKTDEANAVMGLIHHKGNIIVVRGVKGSAPDVTMYAAQLAVLKNEPDVKVVATVYGQCTASVAQSAIADVLPSLPHVDAVLGQGGDDYGDAQGFSQYGGEYKGHMPVIEGGGSSNFIRWWAAEHASNGYTTISMNTTPGIGGAAFWLSLAIVQGAHVPKTLIMPVATVDQSNLAQYANLPPDIIVSPSYSQDWVKVHLLSQKLTQN